MENLNSDVVLEILTRLPKTKTGFKSNLQCREVCRLWRNLLGKPKTGMLFLSRRAYNRDIKLYYREESSEIANFSCIKKPLNFYNMVTKMDRIQTGAWYFRFIGTCNGLLCYAISNFVYIHNPITGERICIPRIWGSEYDADPVGFGYCDSTKTYKVVKIGPSIVEIGNVPKRSVEVYTLGDGSGWRDKPETTYKFSRMGVLANGALHWLDTRSGCDIVAFDLADESFRSVPPPPPCRTPSNPYKHVHLGSLLGRNLYLCLHYREQDERMMDIWVFEKKNINNCRRSSRLKKHNSFTWIRRFSRKWKIVVTHLLSRTKSEILLWQCGVLSCYDATTFKKIWCVAGDAEGSVYGAVSYMHSLVSLKDLGEKRADHLALPKKLTLDAFRNA